MDLLILFATGAGVLWAASYAFSCWWFPWTHCGRCHGAGKHRRDDGKVWRQCKKCRGSGARLRWGRRAHNRWHR